MSATCRAVTLEHFGAPLRIRHFPAPRPPVDGLVIAPRYGGVCGTDLHLRAGHLDVPVPLVLGHEGFGVVSELGERWAGADALGRSLEPGDPVMWASSIACGDCVPCRQYREPTLCERRRTCGVNRAADSVIPLGGSWADAIVLEAGSTVIRLDPGIDPVAAMAFACAGPTMVHALSERRQVRLGELVVVQGSGPVGLAAAALAQLSGAQVCLVGGPRQRLELAAKVGIGHHHIDAVESGDPEAAIDEVLALTGGRGADLVIECTGAPAAIDQGIRMARRGGSYLVVGQYTDAGPTMINPHQIVYRQLEVIGSWAFSGAHVIDYVGLLPELSARFDLPALVTRYPLQEVERALSDVGAGRVMKAVLQT